MLETGAAQTRLVANLAACIGVSTSPSWAADMNIDNIGIVDLEQRDSLRRSQIVVETGKITQVGAGRSGSEACERIDGSDHVA